MRYILLLLIVLTACSKPATLCEEGKLLDPQIKQIVENEQYQKGSIVLTIVPDSISQLKQELNEYNYPIITAYEEINRVVVAVPKDKEVEAICTLEQSEIVERGELNAFLTNDV